MRIGIDFTCASRERAGIGRYARELVRALSRLDRTNRYVLFVPRDAHDDLLNYDWPPNFSIVRAPLNERLLAALWHRLRVPLPIEFFVGRVDILYSPDFLLPPTWARRKLVTVHDLSYVRLPDCFPQVLKSYLDRSVPPSVGRADLVLADAKSTKADLEQVYRVAPEKVKVLYSGVDARFSPAVPEDVQEQVASKYQLRRPFLLSVSTIQPRKNYARLVKAFAQVISRSTAAHNAPDPRSHRDAPSTSYLQTLISDLELVIAGGNGWMYEEVYQTVDQLGLSGRVRFLGFVSDQDLPALYSLATLFVYPSLYEGFGLPVAEAMASGVSVVCSSASSLPEVGGDAVSYFDPRDVDAMAKAIERVLGNDSLRAEMRSKGLETVKQFSWQCGAQDLLRHLEGRGEHP